MSKYPQLYRYWYGLVILSILCMLTILLATEITWIQSKLNKSFLEQTIRAEKKVVQVIRADIEEELARHISILQHTAAALYLTKNAYQKQQFLRSLLLKEAAIQSLHVLNNYGYAVMMAGEKNTKVNYYTPCSHCPVLQIPVSGEIFIETVRLADNKIYTQVAIPITDYNNTKGKVRGVLLAAIDSTGLFQNSRDVLNRKGVNTYITDSSGRFLVSIPGSKYIHYSKVVTSVNKLQWSVVSEIALNTIETRVGSIISYIKLILYAIGFLSFIALFILIKRMTGKISEQALAESRERELEYLNQIGFPDIGQPDYPVQDYHVEEMPEEMHVVAEEKPVIEESIPVRPIVPYKNMIQPPDCFHEQNIIKVWDGIQENLVKRKPAINLMSNSFNKRKLLTYKKNGHKTLSGIFSISQAIEDAVSPFLLTAREKGISLIIQCTSDVPAYVSGDADGFCCIVRYLVRNAVYFTDSGCILIDIQSETAPDNMVKLKVRVKDSGAGIHQNMLDKILGKVNQDESSQELAVCRKLVSLMKGEIGGYSETGKGTVLWFILRLPVVKERSETLHCRINLGKSRMSPADLIP